MAEKETLNRAKKDKREGKAPTTQAGEFVREKIEHCRTLRGSPEGRSYPCQKGEHLTVTVDGGNGFIVT